jgi:predicted dehydrogenase
VTTVNADFYVGAHFGGFRDRMRHVLLLDMAIHTFDAARKISGADPLAVYCHEWNPTGSWYDHDASAIAIFELSGGLVFSYRGSWCSEGLNTTWESEWRIVGTQGSVRWNGADVFQAQAVAETGSFFSKWDDLALPPAPAGMVTGHAGVIREFVDSIRSGRVPETVASDNIKSLAMVFAAIESAERCQRVEISSL